MLHTSFCILLSRVCNFTALFTPQFVFAAARLRIAYTPRLPWLPILHLTFLPCLCCFGAAAALYANAAKYCERPRNSCPFSPYVSAGPTCIWYFFLGNIRTTNAKGTGDFGEGVASSQLNI